MRFVIATLILWGLLTESVAAAPQSNCPSRGQIVDSLAGSSLMSDPWLALSLGGFVGLTSAYLGVPAGIVASVLGGGAAALSGFGAIEALDLALRSNLPDIADRLGRDTDDLYDQMRYSEDIISANWLAKVVGGTLGSLYGLTTSLEIGPLHGVGVSAAMGATGGIVLGDLWHRWALWPFHDNLSDHCRSSANNIRT
jgi:hypothetical protein